MFRLRKIRLESLALIVFLLLGTSSGHLAVSSGGGASALGSPQTMPAADSTPLPGNGLAQHPFLYCGEWDYVKPQQTIYLVRGGKVDWTYSISNKMELGDCWRLSNGNILFTRRAGASEVTPQKQIVWDYDAPPNTEIHSAQPIGKDRVLLMQNGVPAKLMLINIRTGKVEKELTLKTGNPNNVHAQFRRVRMTKAGTLLASHLDVGKVIEYDWSGKELWSVDAPSVWDAVRLDNGNTLISGNQHGWVREVDPRGKTVWEINKNDLRGITLYTVQEVERLKNGNTVICNWFGELKPPDWPKIVQVIEVTPDKKVVWALRDWTDLGPASAIQLLDEPGVPENCDLMH